MGKIQNKLRNLSQGKTCKILGVKVTKNNSEYIIDDQCYTIIDAAEFIEENQSIDSKNPLDHSAFVLVRPGGDPSGVTRAFRINSNVERIALLKHAKSKNLYVYAGSIKLVDGESRVCGPFAFLWDSMPLDTEKKPTKWPSGDVRVVKKNLPDSLDCPYCSLAFSSTSGRTLHIKSKHFEEYE